MDETKCSRVETWEATCAAVGREESVLERVDWLERAEVGGRRMRRGRGGVAGLGFAACLRLLPFACW